MARTNKEFDKLMFGCKRKKVETYIVEYCSEHGEPLEECGCA